MPLATAEIIRFALYVDLMLLVGLPAFALYNMRGSERRPGAVLPWRTGAAGLAVVGGLLSIVAILVSIASMTGVSVDSIDPTLATALITGSAMGWAFLSRLAACLAALMATRMCGRNHVVSLSGVTACGALALGSLVWSGHGVMDAGMMGWLHLIADLAHLLAAGIWLGALVALLWITHRDLSLPGSHQLAVRTLSGFATAGTVVVLTIMLTGCINTWALVLRTDDAPLWSPNPYRCLLALKIAAFAAMLILASLNRLRFTPALERGESRAIRISMFTEAVFAVLILALVSALGSMSPD